MVKKTQGELEAEFTTSIIKLEKDYLGRGPMDARTFFIQDMILVRLRGVLTPAEMKLSEDHDGKMLVKETRRRLFETSRELIDQIVHQILNCDAISLHTDMSTQTGERVIVITVNVDLNKKFG